MNVETGKIEDHDSPETFLKQEAKFQIGQNSASRLIEAELQAEGFLPEYKLKKGDTRL